MNGFQHPGTILLIHEMKVRREIARDMSQHFQGDLPRRVGRGDRNPRLRRALSKSILALARWIAPADAGLATGARR